MNALTLASLPIIALGTFSARQPEPMPPASEAFAGVSFEAEDESSPRLVAAEPDTEHGLRTGKLEAASGLHTGARGLTPDAEWRAFFPRR